MKLNFLLTLSICLVAVTSLFSQAKYSNEFLKIGVGARALGMSNSFVAATKDVNSSNEKLVAWKLATI